MEWNKGKSLSEETKRKISNALKGRKRSDEDKRKISEGRKGMKFDKEHCKNIGKSKANIKQSVSHIEKRLKTREGYTHSTETKKKMSITATGVKLSKEHCINIGKSKLGHVQSAETIEKRVSKIRGKPRKHTDDTKLKLRLAQIKVMERQVFNGMPMMPTVGKNEMTILNNLEKSFGMKIIRQKRIIGYFLDGYIPEFNLAIEIDEKYHLRQRHIEKDLIRQNNIQKAIGCNFLRIKE